MAEACIWCEWKAEAGTLTSGGGDPGMASGGRSAWTEPCGEESFIRERGKGLAGRGESGNKDPRRPAAGCVWGWAGSVLAEPEVGGAWLIFLIVKVMHGSCEHKKGRSCRKIKRRK